MKNLSCALASTLLIAACSSPPPPPAPMPMSDANLAQVMQAIPFHNSNIIFDAQANDPGAPPPEAAKGGSAAEAGATSLYKAVYGGWTAVENASIALSESATLILLPRNCRNGKPAPVDQEDFKKYAEGLVEAGKVSLAAARAKDPDKIVEAAGVVTEACQACHMVYRDTEDEKDRCTPPAAPK
jgi:Cytochrome C'